MLMQAAMEVYAPETAEKVYVGKRGGRKSMEQTEIDGLLTRFCLQVCCLKTLHHMGPYAFLYLS